MKMNSDYANKTMKNLQAEVAAILQAEERDKTYSYSVNEKPHIPKYSFTETQNKLNELRGKIAVIKHAINQFNISTVLNGYGISMDEALGRMSVLHGEKKRLYALLGVPETIRDHSFGSTDADYICRNFVIEDVQKEYDRVCKELMKIQQAINIANLTIEFDVDI